MPDLPAGTRRGLERERKLTLPPTGLPDLSGVADVLGHARHDLDATYLDTITLALTRAGWSLRRRRGGADDGWHLKRPADGGMRVEIQAPDGPVLPESLRAEAAEVGGTDALVPVARVRTRRAETCLGRDGAAVASVAVDEVSATTASGTTRWVECEVELAEDAADAWLDVLVARLMAAGAQAAPQASKAARGLAGLTPADDPDAPAASAATVLRAAISRHVGTLQATDADARRGVPEAVHQARVATRRLRSSLRTYAPSFDADVARPLAGELRWLAASLGAARDADVIAALLDDVAAERGADATEVHRLLSDHLARLARHARTALADDLGSWRAGRLREQLASLLVDPSAMVDADRPAADALVPPTEAAIAEVARLHERALKEPDDLERWHAVRKAAKAVRYAVEAAPALLGGPGAVRRWKAVTESFGAVQDAAVARGVLDARAPAAPRDPAWDALAAALDARAAAALAAGREALEAALSA